MKAIIAIIVILVSTFGTSQAALAADLFYSGDIITDSVGVRIDIGHREATVSAVYVLENRGSETVEIKLEYNYSPASLQVDGETLANPVVFNPGDRKSVTVNFKLNSTGETTQTLSLNPNLLFNGSPNAEPAATLIIEALLPEGINGLAWASNEPDEEGLESGRKHYTWKDADVYPTPLTLKWSTLGVDLSIQKSASPAEITQPNQVINIEITLKNNGNAALGDIHLVDQYVASHFGEIEPATESGTLDNVVFWQKTIGSLGPGETISLNYSVKYIASVPQVQDFELKPTVVTVGGNLVSVSNEVRMKLSGELPTPTSEPSASTPEIRTTAGPEKTPAPEENEPKDSSWLPVIYIGVPIIVIIIAGGFILRARRRAK